MTKWEQTIQKIAHNEALFSNESIDFTIQKALNNEDNDYSVETILALIGAKQYRMLELEFINGWGFE